MLNIRETVFWAVMQCSLIYVYIPLFQWNMLLQSSGHKKVVCWGSTSVPEEKSRERASSALKIELVGSCRMLVLIYQTAEHYIQ